METPEQPRARGKLSEDAAQVRKRFSQRFREALTRPVTLTIAAMVFILTIGAEYAFSRLMDAIWEVEPPEEITRLNTDVRAASDELKQASQDIAALLGRIDPDSISDPALSDQLSQLDQKLLGLNELVSRTSRQTEKVAAISESLRQDWLRLQEQRSNAIDSVPDLMLAVGEGAQLCNGLAAIGVTQLGSNWVQGRVRDRNYSLSSGARQPLGEDAWVDFIGARHGQALFKVHCPA